MLVTSVLVGAAVLLILRRALRWYPINKYTCVHDIEHLGTTRKGGKYAGTAVICGGSFAGLMAARVCSDHFDKVVVVEPEAWTFTEAARQRSAFGTRQVHGSTGSYNALRVDHRRSRVSQYGVVHSYQALLLRFARKVFADFDTIAKSWGMLIRAADLRLSLSGQLLRPPKEEYNGQLPETVWAPRRDLEALFRKLVHDACPTVEFMQGTVTGFRLAPQSTDPVSIGAMLVRLRDGRTHELADCSLVIDCTGVAQAGYKFLSRVLPELLLGLRESYNPNIGYSSLEYPLPPDFDENLRALLPGYDAMDGAIFSFVPDPEVDSRMISLIRRDNAGVVFVTGGWAVDLPTTLDDVRAFAKQVKNTAHVPPYFYQVVDLLEPVQHLGIVDEARVTFCQKINYARASKVLPNNFVALGDASMRVNPRFGQGVAKCAIGAITLDALLRAVAPSQGSFGAIFFKKMKARTGSIWDGAKLADYGALTTIPVAGESLADGHFMRWYRGQLVGVMTKNSSAASALWHSMMFLAPPMDIFSPAILVSIAWEIMTSWLYYWPGGRQS